MAHSTSTNESSDSEEEFSCRDVYCESPDFLLDEYNDEDLSEIAEEKSLKYSLVIGRYKKQKVKLSSSEISAHMKKISPEMIQLDFTEEFAAEQETGIEENSEKVPSRPRTLNLFSQNYKKGEENNGSFHDCLPAKGHRKKPIRRSSEGQSENIPRSEDVSSKTSRSKRKDKPKYTYEEKIEKIDQFLTRSASEWSIDDPQSVEYCYLDGEMKKQTHVSTFKFVPRHSDELYLDIYDPIHVEAQHDDLWYEGLNMRTGEKGIFPCYYAQSVSNYLEEFTSFEDTDSEKFFLYFIGSVEVPCHKGHDVLCQAMYKVAEVRRQTIDCSPPAYVCLMIGARGVKMIDQSALKHYKCRKSSESRFSSSYKVKRRTHFFQMKNISFCGHHPRDEKYFGFITRHPTQYRFACHTFVCESSTRNVIDCFGSAFSRYFQDYMEFVQPAADIYLE